MKKTLEKKMFPAGTRTRNLSITVGRSSISWLYMLHLLQGIQPFQIVQCWFIHLDFPPFFFKPNVVCCDRWIRLWLVVRWCAFILDMTSAVDWASKFNQTITPRWFRAGVPRRLKLRTSVVNIRSFQTFLFKPSTFNFIFFVVVVYCSLPS